MKSAYSINKTVRLTYALMSLLFIVLICILAAQEFPRIVKVQGYVTTEYGVSKLFPTASGIIKAVYHKEGDPVSKGQIVMEIDSERNTSKGTVESSQLNIVDKKNTILHEEEKRIRNAFSNNESMLKTSISFLEDARRNIGEELLLLEKKFKISKKQHERYSDLFQSGFFSIESVESKKSELFEIEARIKSLLRQKSTLEKEINITRGELKLNELRRDAEFNQVRKESTAIEFEKNELQSKTSVLRSPIDGVVGQLTASPGQSVTTDIPIVTILPNNADIEIILYIPSKSAGFILENQTVLIKYQAFSFTHYGLHAGLIKEVSSVALPPTQLPAHIQSTEPIFTVKVAVPSKFLRADLKKFEITSGMLVDADIIIDKPKIYQWILDPIYRMKLRT